MINEFRFAKEKNLKIMQNKNASSRGVRRRRNDGL